MAETGSAMTLLRPTPIPRPQAHPGSVQSIAPFLPARRAKLMDHLREALRPRHYSRRTLRIGSSRRSHSVR